MLSNSKSDLYTFHTSAKNQNGTNLKQRETRIHIHIYIYIKYTLNNFKKG